MASQMFLAVVALHVLECSGLLSSGLINKPADSAFSSAMRVWDTISADGSIGAKGAQLTDDARCMDAVVSGLDNLLGVCQAKYHINDCTTKSDVKMECQKVQGPSGNLITQDITEDVRLGSTTNENTAKWHQAFTKCATQGADCAEAVALYHPVIQSVQVGLADLVKSCHGLEQVALTETDFVDCGKDDQPTVSDKMRSLVQQVRTKLPEAKLARFPLHGVVQWAEPAFKLPAEVEDD